MKIAESRSGSVSQRHGSADPDPDPPQNVMDPQHWLKSLKCFISNPFFPISGFVHVLCLYAST
jgi:hypothetical protein